MQTHIEEILDVLLQEKVSFIVCGGVAAIIHGVERMTIDIDLSIKWTKENVRRAETAFQRLRLRPRVPLRLESLVDEQMRKALVREKNALVFSLVDAENPFRHVDLFLIDELSYSVLLPHSQVKRRIRVLSPEKLLSLKEAISPQREKDLLDIASLRTIIRDRCKR